jgi:AcrR family transcriptional regulator
MANAVALVEVLKRELRARGITYADVAKAIDLSAASVKRLFAQKDFSLERLDAICQLAGMEFTELTRLLEREEHLVSQLTLEQEKEIVADKKLLMAAVCALGHWSYEQILDAYGFTEAELIRLLARLDKLKLIELLPNNKIRPLITRAFTWIPDGPIHQYFKAEVSRDYLDSRFDGVGEVMLLVNGMLSQGSRGAIQARLRQVANEFRELHHGDIHLPHAERFGTSMLVAVRRWEPKFFAALRRPKIVQHRTRRT